MAYILEMCMGPRICLVFTCYIKKIKIQLVSELLCALGMSVYILGSEPSCIKQSTVSHLPQFTIILKWFWLFPLGAKVEEICRYRSWLSLSNCRQISPGPLSVKGSKQDLLLSIIPWRGCLAWSSSLLILPIPHPSLPNIVYLLALFIYLFISVYYFTFSAGYLQYFKESWAINAGNKAKCQTDEHFLHFPFFLLSMLSDFK